MIVRDLLAISDAVLDLTTGLPPTVPRSLDAIHLASAQLLGQDLGAVVSYDRRMLDAAEALGLPTAAPGLDR